MNGDYTLRCRRDALALVRRAYDLLDSAFDWPCTPHVQVPTARGTLSLLVEEGALEPLTLAVRVCCACDRFLGIVEWRGKDAREREPWCITSGLCDACCDATDCGGETRETGGSRPAPADPSAGRLPSHEETR